MGDHLPSSVHTDLSAQAQFLWDAKSGDGYRRRAQKLTSVH